MEPLIPSPNNIVKNEDIGGPPIPLQPKVEHVDSTGSKGNSSESKDELQDEVDGASKEIDEANKESPNSDYANPDRPR